MDGQNHEDALMAMGYITYYNCSFFYSLYDCEFYSLINVTVVMIL